MRNGSFPAWTVCLLFAVALLASGCGSGRLSEDAYIERVNETDAELQQTTAEVLDRAQTGDQPVDPKVLDPLLDAVEGQVREVHALQPPRDWQDEHDRFVRALAGSATALRAMNAAARARDEEALQAASRRHQQSVREVDAALAALERLAAAD